eukprot:4324404-Pyramimonas_sp.AAC.1
MMIWFYITYAWDIVAIYITHVDDILAIASQSFLDRTYIRLSERFGAVKRCVLPLIDVGIRHSMPSPGHYFLDQEH